MPDPSPARKPRLAVLGNAQDGHLRWWIRPFARELDIHVISMESDGLGIDGVTVHHLGRATGTRFDAILAVGEVNRILRHLEPDLLHAHYASSYGYLGGRASVTCPRLLSAWGSDVQVAPWTNPVIRWLMKATLPRYDWVNAPAEHFRPLLARLGVRPERVETFPYGVDLRVLPFAPDRSRTGRYRLLSARAWDVNYRIDAIISGFEHYAATHDDLELVLTGRVTPAGERLVTEMVERSPYRDRIVRLGLADRGRYLEELARCDIAISIPQSDGASLALFEAMACGLLPIVSDIPANSTWVSDERGVIVKCFDAGSIAEACANAVCRLQRGFDPGANRRLVEEHADYSRNMQRMREVYRRFGLAIRPEAAA
jgi:glycosyltransferase involved in cell wall biosynthesis